MSDSLDVIAWPLDKAQAYLATRGYKCICFDLPVVENKKNENGCYVKYVVRQELLADIRTCNLLLCSKFRKEVQ